MGGLTAVHYSREKTYESPFHTLGGGEKLEIAAGLTIYLQQEEQGVKELGWDHSKYWRERKKNYMPGCCAVRRRK
jgi:hypothetical protein